MKAARGDRERFPTVDETSVVSKSPGAHGKISEGRAAGALGGWPGPARRSPSAAEAPPALGHGGPGGPGGPGLPLACALDAAAGLRGNVRAEFRGCSHALGNHVSVLNSGEPRKKTLLTTKIEIKD